MKVSDSKTRHNSVAHHSDFTELMMVLFRTRFSGMLTVLAAIGIITRNSPVGQGRAEGNDISNCSHKSPNRLAPKKQIRDFSPARAAGVGLSA